MRVSQRRDAEPQGRACVATSLGTGSANRDEASRSSRFIRKTGSSCSNRSDSKRGLPRWRFASTNQRRTDGATRRSTCTSRSPRRPLRSRCSRPLKKTGGRNNQGKITVRGRGGGHKRRYRMIDFRRTKDDIDGERSSASSTTRTAPATSRCSSTTDGTRRYILAPRGADRRATEVILSSADGDRAEGRQLHAAPLYPDRSDRAQRVEFEPGKGGALCRSAGCQCSSDEPRRSLGHARAAVGRDPSGVGRLPSDRRRDRQLAITRTSSSARPAATAGVGRKPKVRGVAKRPRLSPAGRW